MNKKQIIAGWISITLLIVAIAFFIANLKQIDKKIGKIAMESISENLKANKEPDPILKYMAQESVKRMREVAIPKLRNERERAILLYSSGIFLIFSFGALAAYVLKDKK